MKALIAVIALLGSVVQETTYDLIWKPKQDQKLSLSLAVDGQVADSPFSLKSDVLLHVKKVEANGDYTLTTSFKNTVAQFFGQEEKIDDEEETQRYNARGDLVGDAKKTNEEDTDVVGELLSRAGEYQAPPKAVKVGDKWSHTYPEDKKKSLPKATAQYQLLSDTDGKLKISIDYKEDSGADPTTAKGIALIEVKDFTPISVESELKNLRFAEGVPPGTAKLKMARK